MRFSIITPAYIWTPERLELFLQCIDSIRGQTFSHADIEHIIVNDGSPMDMAIPNYPWIKVINQPNLQRMAAYNTGLRQAQGDIIGLLDSDDEYAPESLMEIHQLFQQHQDYDMVNVGCTYINIQGTTWTRGPFQPKECEVGHEVFGGGNIVNGTFFFKRAVYEDLGAFPEGIKTIDVPWYKNTELF